MRCGLNYRNSIKNLLFTGWAIIFHDKDNGLCNSWFQYQIFFLLSPQYLAPASGSCVQPSPAGVRTLLEVKSLPGEFCLQLELFSHPSSFPAFPGFPVRNHQCVSCWIWKAVGKEHCKIVELVTNHWRIPSLPPDLQWENAQHGLVYLKAIKDGSC